MRRSLQFISDLHLEFRKGGSKKIASSLIEGGKEINAKYLVLAGDIATNNLPSLLPFLKTIETGPWDRIFYIPGNHEYYQKKPYYIIQKDLAELTAKTRVELLLKKRVELPEITLLGTTLWSEISPSNTFDILTGMNDFQCIHKANGKRISLQDYMEWHTSERKWLEEELEKPSEVPYWVVTHYLPSMKCIHEKYKDSKLNSAFASNLDYLFPKVEKWIFGHTHTSINIQVDKTHLISNPLGYPGEESGYLFTRHLTI